MEVVRILVAATVGFGIGAIWYMALLRYWVKVAQLPQRDDGSDASGAEAAGILPFVVSGLCMLLVAGMLGHILALAGVHGPFQSMLAGLGVGLFFIAPWTAMNYANALRPPILTLIDGGHAVVACTAMGLVLGMF